MRGKTSSTAAPFVSEEIEAFTLIELLVVVGIIAVLAALLFPLGGKLLTSALNAKSLHNMRQVGGSLFSYAADHDGSLPDRVKSGIFTNADGSVTAGTIGYWHYLLDSGGYVPDRNVFYNPKEKITTFPQFQATGPNKLFSAQGNPIYGLRDITSSAIKLQSVPGNFFVLVESWSVGAFTTNQPGYFVSTADAHWCVKIDKTGYSTALFADGHGEREPLAYFTNLPASQTNISGGKGYKTYSEPQ